jgi:methionine synthase I (cobalamin-dependent)
MRRTDELLEMLSSGVMLVADGATGTMLMAAGLPQDKVPEQWNIEQPDRVRALHAAYLNAGSNIVLTNTFGGSRLKLERAGCGSITQLTNKVAAMIAKGMAGDRAYVAGDIGPSGEMLQPYGTLSYEDAVTAFAEQAAALAEGGVDCLWIETMTALEEMEAALEGAQKATDLPVFCTMSYGPSGRTMMGVAPEQAITTLWPKGIAACGANCGQGPESMVAVIEQLSAAMPEATIIAKPNAGLPRLVGDEQVFDMGPEAMAGHVMRCVDAGARIIGGCCGSSPDHVRAMAAALAAR